MLECIVNVSEGRDAVTLGQLAEQAGDRLLDRHADRDHHRAVFTLGGPDADVEAAVRALAAEAVARLDLARHDGAHPRFGVLDVVPFVALGPDGAATEAAARQGQEAAVGARDRFARWAGDQLGLPCFLFGSLPDGGFRTLPEVRRRAFVELAPDTGPPDPHPRAGAAAVGARGPLVAYNLWLDGGGSTVARALAAAVRGPAVRALGFELAGKAQVSTNLVRPEERGPEQVFDEVARLAAAYGRGVRRAELVGLVPEAVLRAVPARRWSELDLSEAATVEAPPPEAGQEALTIAARRCRARARRSRRRSRSLMPPQMPNFSPLPRAYSRQSSRTTHPRQTSLASLVEAPRSGKNRSGSTPMQLAWACQLRSCRPYKSDTMSTVRLPFAW